jgi:heptosyltransferase I
MTRVLLTRPGAFGDVCLALPLAHALQRHCEVHWLIRPHYAPVLDRFPAPRLHALPTDILPDRATDFDSAAPFPPATIERIRRLRFDAVLDLSHWPEVARLVHHLGAIPRRGITFDPDQDARLGVARPGLDHYGPYNCRVPVDPQLHQAGKWRALVRAALGLDLIDDWQLPPLRPPGRRLRVFVHPHAAKPAKVWPAPAFVALLERLARERPVECLINSGHRREWAAAAGLWARLIARGVRARVVVRDRSYRRLADVLSGCDLALGNDSGPLHFAALLGVPTVVVYGPYPWREFGPPWRSTPVAPPPGQSADAVPADAVLEAVRQSLDKGGHHAAA